MKQAKVGAAHRRHVLIRVILAALTLLWFDFYYVMPRIAVNRVVEYYGKQSVAITVDQVAIEERQYHGLFSIAHFIRVDGKPETVFTVFVSGFGTSELSYYDPTSRDD